MRRFEESRMRREEVRSRNEVQRELWEAWRAGESRARREAIGSHGVLKL